MAEDPVLCPACVEFLKTACTLGGRDQALVRTGASAELCGAYEGYVTTGDEAWLMRAREFAPPALVRTVTDRLVARGLVPPQ